MHIVRGLAVCAAALLSVGWHELGGSATGSGIATGTSPSLAVDPSGYPVVAYRYYDSVNYFYSIHVRRWDGSSWLEVGGGPVVLVGPNDRVDQPSLALDGDGNPVVAWTFQPWYAASEIHLKRWDGSAWVELGGSATGGGVSATSAKNSSDPSVDVDSDGNPVVAWQETHPSHNWPTVYLRRWNGASWEELGGSATGPGLCFNTLSEYGGGALVRADSNDNPVVAWQGLADIYLRVWDGSAWVELGGSATGQGVSGSLSGTSGPSLALDSADRPALAFTALSPSYNPEIFFRHWNGATWEELAGSGSGSGISNTPDASFEPSLAFVGGEPLVAWSEYTGYAWSQYSGMQLRRWNGAAWTEVGSPAASAGSVSAVDASGDIFVAWPEGPYLQTSIWLQTTAVPLPVAPAASGGSDKSKAFCGSAAAAPAGSAAWILGGSLLLLALLRR